MASFYRLPQSLQEFVSSFCELSYVNTFSAVVVYTEINVIIKSATVSNGRSITGTYAHDYSQIQVRPDLRKTKMCQANLEGRCPYRAEECQFAHSTEDLKATPGLFKTVMLFIGRGW